MKVNKFLLVIAISIILIASNFINILLLFLYLKNGNSFNYYNYKIELPIFHWAYYDESNIAYVFAGRKVDGKNLFAEFIKNPKKVNVNAMLKSCEKSDVVSFDSSNLSGKFYICKKNNNEILYFQNKDKDLFIRETSYSSNNNAILNEYKLLLKNIKKVSK